MVFTFVGFEQADQLAGEVKNPQRNLPRALIPSVFIATLIYKMLQVVFIGRSRTARSRAGSPRSATQTS